MAAAGRPVAAQTSLGPSAPSNSQPPPVQPAAPGRPQQGFSFNPDAGMVYQSGDFRLTAWGFAERALGLDVPGYFRRVRQGAEIDLPRLSDNLRLAAVYEFDLTDTNAFGINPGPAGRFGSRDAENLFIALQDADDPGRFRALLGENTHILSRDDNLSSGNLPTINRSLIIEEHGSVNSFGTQFGIQLQKALSDQVTVQLAALDNRGSLNTPAPRYAIGNSLSGKIILTPIDADGRKLTVGAAVDHTRNIRNRIFTLATAIGAVPLGGTPATGSKLTGEADIAYTFPLLGHAATIEGEAIYSRFSGSRSDVGGGYAMAQISLFDAPRTGDLDVFVRYDMVSLGSERIAGRALQTALRAGFNYNLPRTNKLASLHLEYARNTLSGPAAIVTDGNPGDELRVVLRISLQRYTRH